MTTLTATPAPSLTRGPLPAGVPSSPWPTTWAGCRRSPARPFPLHRGAPRRPPAGEQRAQAVLERVGAPQRFVEAARPGGEAAVLLLQPRGPVLQATRVGLGLVELVLQHRLVARGHRAQLV